MAPKSGTVRRLTRLPLTKARIHLGAVVKRARLGKEYFILEKDGIPVAGLMGIDEFEATSSSKIRRLAPTSSDRPRNTELARAARSRNSLPSGRRLRGERPRGVASDARFFCLCDTPLRPARASPLPRASGVPGYRATGDRHSFGRPYEPHWEAPHPKAGGHWPRRWGVAPPPRPFPLSVRHRARHSHPEALLTPPGGHLSPLGTRSPALPFPMSPTSRRPRPSPHHHDGWERSTEACWTGSPSFSYPIDR